MIRITVSFPDEQHAWLSAEAARSGTSMTAVIQALVEQARIRGFRVETQPPARVTE